MITNSNRITSATLACYLVIVVVCEARNANIGDMPSNWPQQWNTGIIPFVFDYYSSNLKRLINMVLKGVKFIEDRGCLIFEERNPIEMAQELNTTYLYYSYSGVLEECCGTYFNKKIGRRLVLITPMCRNPAEIVHATLHAMGLTHNHDSRFSSATVNAVLFPDDCLNNYVSSGHEKTVTPDDLDGLKIDGTDVGTPYTKRPRSSTGRFD